MAVHKIAFKAAIVRCNRFVVILRYVGHVLKKSKGISVHYSRAPCCDLMSCEKRKRHLRDTNLHCKIIRKYAGQLWVRLNTNQTFTTDNAPSKGRLQDNVNTHPDVQHLQDKQIMKMETADSKPTGCAFLRCTKKK